MKKKPITASELEKKFDAGESVLQYFDTSQGRRLNVEQKRVNVDFPVWMIHSLDAQARKMGVTRQSVIKMWLAERLKQAEHPDV